jgi:hypothetical protein
LAYDSAPERKTEKKKLDALIKKERKDRKDYVTLLIANIINNNIKNSTVKPLTAEQKQEVKNSPPGPLQKVIHM